MGILAGAIGGFGTGLGRGLEQMQSGVQAYGLQQADRAFQMERLAEQNRFQAEQGDLTRKSAAQESLLTREAVSREGVLTRDNATTNMGMQITSSESMSERKLTQELNLFGLGEASKRENEKEVHNMAVKQLEATLRGDANKLTETRREFDLLSNDRKDVTDVATARLFSAEQARVDQVVAKYAADGIPVPKHITEQLAVIEKGIASSLASIASRRPKEAEIKMPGTTPTPQAPFSLLGEPSDKQPIGTNSVLRHGGTAVDQTPAAAAAVVPEAEPGRVPLLERMAMPRGGRVPPEKIAEVNTNNLNVEVQNLITDVENAHRSPNARTYDMTKLETLSKDPRLSEAQRYKIRETIVQATGDIRAGNR